MAFFYQRIRASDDLNRLGKVKLYVTSASNGRDAVTAIHRTGAAAFRYIQAYWYPAWTQFDGLDISKHANWAFCSRGNEPLAAATRGDARHRWWFLDMNEQGVHEHFRARFATLKAQGWDGVFLDRGFASMTGNDDPPPGIWNRTSTCTDDPVARGARFADAYVGMTSDIAKSGLQLIVNYGLSPFDARTSMRPDPRSGACDDPASSNCPRLDDVWDHTTWVLDEAAAHPRDLAWENDFRSNQANEQNAAHGRNVIALVTQSTVGGDSTRENVFFAWARIKLFSIPVAVGTGDDGCPGTPTGSLCNRQAAYPELANIRLGAPRTGEPRSQDCASDSSVRCVWSRAYEHGLVVVNAKPTDTVTALPLGSDGCRYVTDVYTRTALEGGRCVKVVQLSLPPWSGRPLLLSTTPG